MHIKNKSQRGFTLTEAVIALAINAFLFLALITLFITTLEHYNKNLNTNLLNEQLQATVQMMSDQIRRAGYWANAQSNVDTTTNTNPFMQSGIDVSTNVGNTCILFGYDRDGNNALPSISSSYDDERYGYRLSGGAIQARPFGAAFDCSAAATAWDNMTDTSIITITNLTFTITQQSLASGSHSLLIRSVDISVTGRLATDTSITKTITEHVRIRNDKYVP